MNGKVHVLVFDGFADWEPAHALAELRRSGGLDVVAVGFTDQPVSSVGGLRVLPEITVDAVDPAAVRVLILPGGEMWERAAPPAALVDLLRRLEDSGIPIAAICAATLAAAHAGLLNTRRHTSNGREYLADAVPDYTGAELYLDELAVRDRGVITASGVGNVEFAREIMAELGVLGEAELAVWYGLFKYGKVPEPA
jgi:putative intracellular protease/amidase